MILIVIEMGVRASTVAQSAGGNSQSSTGTNETTMQGFSVLRSLPGGVGVLQHQHQQGSQSQTSRVSGDNRQRARSLSSVPDLSSGEQGALASTVGVGVAQALGLPQLDSDDADEDSGRVYAAHSLPSHIWSLNGRLSQCIEYRHNLYPFYLLKYDLLANCFCIIKLNVLFYIEYYIYIHLTIINVHSSFCFV